jgi:hypothetical protein
MFAQTWKKYLPVITILLKRSVNEEQTFSMNHTDFERAAGGRKIKYSFAALRLNNGRIDNTVKHTPLARDLAVVLQEDEQTRKLLQQQQFEFSMNNAFQLLIRNITPAPEPQHSGGEADETSANG